LGKHFVVSVEPVTTTVKCVVPTGKHFIVSHKPVTAPVKHVVVKCKHVAATVKHVIVPVKHFAVTVDDVVTTVKHVVTPVDHFVALHKAFLRTSSSGIPKINLIAPNPKGSKLIFFTPFRAGANEENQYLLNNYIQAHN
jgi:hypothetical protein